MTRFLHAAIGLCLSLLSAGCLCCDIDRGTRYDPHTGLVHPYGVSGEPFRSGPGWWMQKEARRTAKRCDKLRQEWAEECAGLCGMGPVCQPAPVCGHACHHGGELFDSAVMSYSDPPNCGAAMPGQVLMAPGCMHGSPVIDEGFLPPVQQAPDMGPPQAPPYEPEAESNDPPETEVPPARLHSTIQEPHPAPAAEEPEESTVPPATFYAPQKPNHERPRVLQTTGSPIKPQYFVPPIRRQR